MCGWARGRADGATWRCERAGPVRGVGRMRGSASSMPCVRCMLLDAQRQVKVHLQIRLPGRRRGRRGTKPPGPRPLRCSLPACLLPAWGAALTAGLACNPLPTRSGSHPQGMQFRGREYPASAGSLRLKHSLLGQRGESLSPALPGLPAYSFPAQRSTRSMQLPGRNRQ